MAVQRGPRRIGTRVLMCVNHGRLPRHAEEPRLSLGIGEGLGQQRAVPGEIGKEVTMIF